MLKKIFKNNFNVQKGFTLLEIVISATIIIILTSIVFINYPKGKQRFALQRSAHKLAQDVRRAQEFAMSTKEFEGVGISETGYGIVFRLDWEDGKKYRLYADTGGGDEFFTSPASDTVIETINLEKGVFIKDLCTESVCGKNKVSVNFKPPDPKVKIGSSASESKLNTTIILALESDPESFRTITVNKAGLVDIE